MKRLLIAIGFLMPVSSAMADSKLTALTQDTTAQTGDLIYKVDNPGGTPVSRSFSVGNFLSLTNSIYSATSTASFPYGLAASTMEVTANGNTQIIFDDNAGSGDPTITLNDIFGSSGGNLLFQRNGTNQAAFLKTSDGWYIYVSTNSGLAYQPRMYFSDQNDNITKIVGPIFGVNSTTYTWPSSYGSSGQFLQSNGAGTLTFATASGGGYAVQPATVTFQMNKGFSASTGTFTSLSPGVMHVVATSSNVTTALVSLSTEVTGSLPAASIAAGSLGSSVLASSVAASGVTAGSYGTTTQVSSFTVGGDGRISNAANVTVTPAASSITSGVLGTGVIASSASAIMLVSSFPVTGVTAASYTSTNLTIDAYGRITSASNGSGISGSTSAITMMFSNGGSVLTAGSTSSVTVPYACTISSWTILAPRESGSITVSVKKATFANFPTLTDMVGAGNAPSLSSAQKNSATPTSWTSTSLAAGDSVSFIPSGITSSTWVNVVLWLIRS